MNDYPALQLTVGRKWNNELKELMFLPLEETVDTDMTPHFPNVLLTWEKDGRVFLYLAV